MPQVASLTLALHGIDIDPIDINNVDMKTIDEIVQGELEKL
jgi:hypothetical protein